MKKVASGKLKSFALAKGATLEVDGEVFNASKSKATGARPVAPQEPPPAAPLPPSVSAQEVQRLLDERDDHWRAEIARIESVLRARAWNFKVSYTKDGRVEDISATPTYLTH